MPVSRAMRAISFWTSMPLAACPIWLKARDEQAEGVEVARVGLEADLQLRQRLHPVVRLVAREVQLGGSARVDGVGLVVQQALDAP